MARKWDGRIVIETERLCLRGFVEADLPHFAAMHTDPAVMQYLGGSTLAASVTADIAAAAQNGFDTTGVGKIAVARRSDGVFLGMCGLSIESWYPNDIEVGWRLGRAYWGHGYASEAGAAWLDHAFRVLGAPRVISVTDVPNRRSIAVMERIGLTLDHHAELTDESGSFPAVIYSMNLAQWAEKARS